MSYEKKLFSAALTRGVSFAFFVLLLMAASISHAFQKDTTPEMTQYFAANAFYNKHLYKLAADQYKSFVLKYPEHKKILSAKLGLALCYFKMKKIHEAEAIFRELASRPAAPRLEQVHNLLGQCLLISGKPAEAERAFRWSVNRGKEKYYQELPGVGQDTAASPRIAMPTDSEPLEHSFAGLVEALYLQGKWAETVKTAKELAKLAPSGEYTPRARFLSAMSNYNLKKYQAAGDILRSLIHSSPSFPYKEDAYFLLADCLNNLGKTDEAIKNNEIVARKLHGKLAVEALFRMGYIKFMTKEYRSALKDFSDLRVLYPKHKLTPEAGIYQGRCCLELEQYRKAQAIFGELSEKNPVKAKATLWLSETFIRQKKYDAAVATLKPALKAFAGDQLHPNLLFNYASALMGLKRFDEAASEFARVAKDFKEFTLTPDAIRMRAFCLNRAADYKKSLELCEKFLSAYPQNPSAEDVAFLKAENLYYLDKYADAIKAYRQFIPWEGKRKYTDEARFRIAEALCALKKYDDALVELKPVLREGVKGSFFAQLHYIAGVCEFNLGSYEDAIRDLKKFASDYPTKQNAAGALLKAAIAYIKLDKNASAMELLQKIKNTYPKSSLTPQVLAELGRLQYVAKKYKVARANLSEVIAKHSDSLFIPQAEYYLGWIAVGRKKTDEALEHFQIVVDKYPKSRFAPISLFQQGVIHLERNEYAKAQKKFKDFIDLYQGDPNIEKAQFYYAVTLSRQKQYDASSDVFKQFIKNNPRSPMIQRALYESAWRARGRKQYNEARDNYNALLKKYPSGKLADRAAFELADLEYETKNYDKAIALLDKLMARGLNDEMRQKALYREAWCFLGRKQKNEALDVFEQLIKDYPKSEYVPVAAYQAGEIRLEMKDFETAYKHYLESVTADKNSKIREQALLRLGETQTLTDKWLPAKKSFETFMEEFPKSKYSRRAQLWRGWCRENLKQYESAIRDYRAVLQYQIRDAISARARFQIGECLMAMREYEKAVLELVKVEVNYGRFKRWASKAMLEMGQALDKLGKKKQALEQYKKVAAKFVGTNEAAVANELIQQHLIYSKDDE
ncbi:MAG: tetratricopeptide repeat protein [Kiritimatiellaeota bacterium]|nr:tetratricopeptide repeat protein [Kiritimatiellota bacterium]